MIIWINGAFGAGKTQTAYELYRRIPNSYVYDPENAGFFIRKNIPKGVSKGDFQNYPMWREFNYSMIKYICSEYSGTLIIPMTVVNPQFFDEMVGRLRREGIDVNHFALCASKETLLKRLRSRGERNGSWAAQQIERCMAGLSNDIFKYHLETDHMSIETVAETIAGKLGIALETNNKGKLRKRVDRLITQIQHMRFF